MLVGIDVQAEYNFKDLDPKVVETKTLNTAPIIGTPRTATKQTNITDTFKERKRRNTEIDICQAKEKKKRNNGLVNKLNTLRESFGKTTKELQDDLMKSKDISNTLVSNIDCQDQPISSRIGYSSELELNGEFESSFICDRESTENMAQASDAAEEVNDVDDNCIDNLLDKIEKEISRAVQQPKTCSIYSEQKHIRPPIFQKPDTRTDKLNPTKKEDNFSFIDRFEKNIDLSSEDVAVERKKQSGFAEAIKCQIQHYLHNARLTSEEQSLAHPHDLLNTQQQPQRFNRIAVDTQGTNHEAVQINHADDFLPECHLQGQNGESADNITNILDIDDASCNRNNKNDIIDLCNNNDDEPELEDRLTQNILYDHKETSIDPNIHNSKLDGDVKMTKECGGKNDKINIYEVIKIHEQVKKSYLKEPQNESRAKCMISGNDNLEIVTTDVSRTAMPSKEEDIKPRGLIQLSSEVSKSSRLKNGNKKQNCFLHGKHEIMSTSTIENIEKIEDQCHSWEQHTYDNGSLAHCTNDLSKNLIKTKALTTKNNMASENKYSKVAPFTTIKVTTNSNNTLERHTEQELGSETEHVFSSDFKDNPTIPCQTKFATFDRSSTNARQSLSSRSPQPDYYSDTTYHTKHYSYTATEIGVWTQQNKNSTLQVIKKLKFGVDLTEIIVQKDNPPYGKCEEQCATGDCNILPNILNTKDTQLNDNISGTIHHTNDVNDEMPKAKQPKLWFVPKTHKNSATLHQNYIERSPPGIAKDEKNIDADKEEVRASVKDMGKCDIETILRKYAKTIR